METDSLLARRFEPSYGTATGKFAPRNSYSAIVVHTTGWGPVSKHLSNPQKFPTPLDAAVHIYKNMPYSAHYVIDQEGTIIQMCPEALASWHVGGSKAWRYQNAWLTSRYTWWRERWPELQSPVELAEGKLWTPYPKEALAGPLKYFRRLYWASRRGSVNANTIGIEVIPSNSGPRSSWSSQAWKALVGLCQDIHHRRGIPLTKHHLLSHSDACPISRTTRNGDPWDPWESQWSWPRFVVEATQRGLQMPPRLG